MDGFSGEVLSRLPLADAVLSLLSFAIDPDFLDQIFDQHRGRCYEDVLKFPAMVNLICDALLEHDGSGRHWLRQDCWPTGSAVLHADR